MPVYEYKGQHYELADGLSNDQALAKIKSHLGEASPAPVAAPAAPREESAAAGLMRGASVGAKAAIRAISSPMNIAADGIAGGMNVVANLFGLEGRVPYMGRGQREGLDNLLPGKAVTMPEKMLEGGIEALSGAAGFNAVAGASKALEPLVTKGVSAVTAAAAGGATAPVIYAEAKDLTGDTLTAGIISALGAGMVGKAAGGAAGKFTDKTPKPMTLDEIKQRSQRAYSELESSGVSVNPWSIRGMLNSAERKLEVSRLDPQVKAKFQTLRDYTEDFISQGKPVPISKIDEMRKYATELRRSNDASVRRLGGQMIDEIDDYMGAIPRQALVTGTAQDAKKAAEAVDRARQDWLQYSRAKVIQNVLETAEVKSNRLTAAQAEQVRQGLISLATSESKKKLFSKGELEAIVRATKDGPVGEMVSQIARFNPQRGGFLGSGTAGAAVAGVSQEDRKLTLTSAALGAAGWSADQIAKLMHNSRGRKLLSDIANGTVKPPPPSEFPRGMFGGAITMPEEDTQ